MSKDIKKALEHCIEWNCADCPNREELGSGETVCRGRLLPEVLEYVADLEAKLADSEKKVKHWHNLYNERDKQFQSVRQRYHLLNKLQSNYDKKDKLHLAYMQCAELVNENEQLKQQLAEKDEEIAYMTKQAKKFNSEAQKYYEDAYCNDFHNQDKISFAIGQLEKVKMYIDDHAYYIDEREFGIEINEYIDNQINELKGKVETKLTHQHNDKGE